MTPVATTLPPWIEADSAAPSVRIGRVRPSDPFGGVVAGMVQVVVVVDGVHETVAAALGPAECKVSEPLPVRQGGEAKRPGSRSYVVTLDVPEGAEPGDVLPLVVAALGADGRAGRTALDVVVSGGYYGVEARDEGRTLVAYDAATITRDDGQEVTLSDGSTVIVHTLSLSPAAARAERDGTQLVIQAVTDS